ncbi:glycosyltransferase family 2 protein [Parachitinimonas caeni]|uniref:Glycosyltransferase n=1 Tax=Parachitinimonas caeni TaxID=3031301 RepID=A0ABT7DRU9_9NEIS|nr:glycosyltransferase [Parachitinimonas caeni]MDK2122794.1 glycosyltransferase [Parachitinimonas caeni]
MNKKLDKLVLFGRYLLSHPRLIPQVIYGLFEAFGKYRFNGIKAFINHFIANVGFNPEAVAKEYDQVWRGYKATMTPEKIGAAMKVIKNWTNPPLISVIVPTYNTPEHLLRTALDSVLNQWYPHWELCISDDGSPDPRVREILEEYKARDSRVKVLYSQENTNAAAASNRALNIVRGQYIALLDHDDVYEPQALYRLADAILADQPDMIYSDEIIVNDAGDSVVAFVFRPAFSLELLRNHPYIVHLVCFKAETLKAIGAFNETLKISQDYDLILRVAEQAKAITHIPEVLYQWRLRPSSSGHQQQSEVMAVSKQVLCQHLQRSNLPAASVVDGDWFNFFRIEYPQPEKARVAVVIPTKNHHALVKQCVESLKKTILDVEYDIVLVDHDSNDPESLAYFALFAEQPNHILLKHSGDFNFSSINNGAIDKIAGKYSHYLLCNNDIEAIESGWLNKMLSACYEQDVGAVGAMLYYPDGEMIQHAGVCVGLFGAAEHFGKFMGQHFDHGGLNPGYIGSLIARREMSAVTAACLLVKADVFHQIQGMEEKMAVGFGDVDFCLRIRDAGYRIMFCPDARLIHHESVSRGKSTTDPHPVDSAFFRDRWFDLIERGDPYYNPNLDNRSTCWDIWRPFTWQLFPRKRVFRNNRFSINN